MVKSQENKCRNYFRVTTLRSLRYGEMSAKHEF